MPPSSALRLEDGGGMALAAQEIGAGEPGRAAADDGHLLAGRRAGRGQLEAVLKRIVADIVLDRVDADVVFDLVAIAAVLARRRADAPHDGRERIGLHHALEGVFLPCHARRAALSKPRTMLSQPRMSCPDGQLPWQGGVRWT